MGHVTSSFLYTLNFYKDTGVDLAQYRMEHKGSGVRTLNLIKTHGWNWELSNWIKTERPKNKSYHCLHHGGTANQKRIKVNSWKIQSHLHNHFWSSNWCNVTTLGWQNWPKRSTHLQKESNMLINKAATFSTPWKFTSLQNTSTSLYTKHW